MPFNTTFYDTPVVMVAVDHRYNRRFKGSRLPENNIISAWVEVGLYLSLKCQPPFCPTPVSASERTGAHVGEGKKAVDTSDKFVPTCVCRRGFKTSLDRLK